MDPAQAAQPASQEPAPKWQALNATQRRVIGVLIEKAKTTPDTYPLTLNALTTGCNQKNNRDPQMNLQADQVEQALEELRQLGAVVEVQGGGRVPKYRHQMYEWLGVDKVELSVVAELLLRGPQTVGELRGHVARMEPIADLTVLKSILQSLLQKRLLVELTPEGRGQVVCHGLYKEREWNDIRARHTGAAAEGAGGAEDAEPGESSPRPRTAPSAATLDMFAELRVEVAELRAEVSRLRTDLAQLREDLGQSGPAATDTAE